MKTYNILELLSDEDLNILILEIKRIKRLRDKSKWKNINDSGLGIRFINCFKSMDIEFIEELTNYSINDFQRILGSRRLPELNNFMTKNNLSFKDS